MIRPVIEDGQTFPRAYCDVCEKIIERPAEAYCEWIAPDDPEISPTEFFFTHPECSRHKPGAKERQWEFTELSTFLVSVLTNMHEHVKIPLRPYRRKKGKTC